MNDPIKEVTGADAKRLLAQFLGQNIGEIKKLDNDIVAGNSTLRGLTLDINSIGQDIPTTNVGMSQPPFVPPPPAPRAQVAEHKTIPSQEIAKEWVGPVTVTHPKKDTDQIEFDFNLKPSHLFDKLDAISKQNNRIENLLKDVLKELQSSHSFKLKKNN